MAAITESSVLETLSRSFANTNDLWLDMAIYRCIFSGSRALEFFVEGSCNEKSGWNFFVPANGHCFVGMIKAFQKAGVVFDSPFAWVVDSLKQSGVVLTTVVEAQRLLYASKHFWEGQDLSEAECALLNNLEKMLLGPTIMRESFHLPGITNNVSVAFNDYANTDHFPGLRVVRGHTWNGQRVELSHAYKISPTTHVLRAPSSAAQCFVSPYGAGHFYFHDTKMKRSFPWYMNSAGVYTDGTPAGNDWEKAMRKYAQRGYDVSESDNRDALVVRHLQDENSYFKTFSIAERPLSTFGRVLKERQAYPGLVTARVKALKALTWHETDDGTVPLYSQDHGPKPEMLPMYFYFEDAERVCGRFAVDVRELSWISPHGDGSLPNETIRM